MRTRVRGFQTEFPKLPGLRIKTAEQVGHLSGVPDRSIARCERTWGCEPGVGTRHSLKATWMSRTTTLAIEASLWKLFPIGETTLIATARVSKTRSLRNISVFFLSRPVEN